MNGFGGFVEDSEFNMFKGVTFNSSFSYILLCSRMEADCRSNTFSVVEGGYVITLPAATTDTWQAQMLVGTDIATSAG